MKRAYLGIGSNQGDRQASLLEAIRCITNLPGVILSKVSGLYETEPVGNIEQAFFLNAVVEIETKTNAITLFKRIQGIEIRMGRTRTLRWGPRTIDIDLLAVDSCTVHTATLDVPHLELANRRFVLVPFNEIAPGFNVPGLDKNIQQLLNETTDICKVELYLTSTAVKKKLKEV